MKRAALKILTAAGVIAMAVFIAKVRALPAGTRVLTWSDPDEFNHESNSSVVYVVVDSPTLGTPLNNWTAIGVTPWMAYTVSLAAEAEFYSVFGSNTVSGKRGGFAR